MDAENGQVVRCRVHNSYVWLGGLRASLMILFIAILSSGGLVVELFAMLLTGDAGGSAAVMVVIMGFIGGVAVLFGLVMLFRYLSYKNLYFELTSDEFNLYSGILTKKRVHVPYVRIQSVDQTASLLNRLLGVCMVKIDTAGGSANKAVVVPYVTVSQAEWLRTELFARKLMAVNVRDASAAQAQAQAGAQANVLDGAAQAIDGARGLFSGDRFDTGVVTYEYGLSNKELLLTGLSNSSAFVVIVLGLITGASQIIGMLSMVLGDGVEDSVSNAALGAFKMFGPGFIVASVAAFLGIAVFMWLISGLSACLMYGGFKARRRGDRIEVEYGLLQHRFQGVNIDRVQSVTVKQSFIRRLFGYCEVRIGKIDSCTEDSSGQNKQVSQGMVVHPFVKMEYVPAILAGLLPEFDELPTQQIPVAPVALRRGIIRRCLWQGAGFWTAVTVTLLYGMMLLICAGDADGPSIMAVTNTIALVAYIFCVLLLVLDAIGALLWYKRSSFAYNRSYMQITNGGYSVERVTFSRRRIQFAVTQQNPFQRHAQVASVCARTAAGVGGTTVMLRDVSVEDAQSWLNWVKPRPRS